MNYVDTSAHITDVLSAGFILSIPMSDTEPGTLQANMTLARQLARRAAELLLADAQTAMLLQERDIQISTAETYIVSL